MAPWNSEKWMDLVGLTSFSLQNGIIGLHIILCEYLLCLVLHAGFLHVDCPLTIESWWSAYAWRLAPHSWIMTSRSFTQKEVTGHVSIFVTFPIYILLDESASLCSFIISNDPIFQIDSLGYVQNFKMTIIVATSLK